MTLSPLQTKYRDSLDSTSLKRYLSKIKIIQSVDPYDLQDNLFDTDFENWPDFGFPDIYIYLVQSKSSYTSEQLKAYKSLQSYNYYVSGFVSSLSRYHFKGLGLSVFKCRVKHSQKMSAPPLLPWAIVADNGSVSSGHCTCMAGIGEVR